MNTMQVQITGKWASKFVKQYGYAENTIFNVVRLCFDNVTGKISQFSIRIPKEKTGFATDTIADFSGKEGRIMGMFDLTITK